MIPHCNRTQTAQHPSSLPHVPGFLADERGATAIEYSLIAAVVCVPLVAALSAVGTQTSALWLSVASKIVTAMGWK